MKRMIYTVMFAVSMMILCVGCSSEPGSVRDPGLIVTADMSDMTSDLPEEDQSPEGSLCDELCTKRIDVCGAEPLDRAACLTQCPYVMT